MTDQLINFFDTGDYISSEKIVEDLIITSSGDICDLVISLNQKPVTKYNIPQYSNYSNGTFEMIKYLRMAGDFGPSYTEVGEHFLSTGHNINAYTKYGENHSKLSDLLGITVIKKTDRKRVYLTELGRTIEKLEYDKQEDCFIKLAGRIPIIQEALKNNIMTSKELEDLLNIYLSPKTALRRKKNNWVLIYKIRGCDVNGV